jgi:hypothetical protein
MQCPLTCHTNNHTQVQHITIVFSENQIIVGRNSQLYSWPVEQLRFVVGDVIYCCSHEIHSSDNLNKCAGITVSINLA